MKKSLLRFIPFLVKEEHKIVLVVEFNVLDKESTQKIINNLSNYVSSVIRKQDIIITDFQSFQKGFRLTYTITYNSNKVITTAYTKALANISNWLYDCNGLDCLYKYYYNYS